jgi:hypothetical protein
MASLRYLFDENLRGPPWRAIQWHNRRGVYPLDAVRVGDLLDLPLGSLDPQIIAWAEAQSRILISADRDTLASHLRDHLAAGHHSPGIFLVRSQSTIPEVIEFPTDAAYASTADEWRDFITYIP